MGILDALTTAVGGMRAQSYALGNISGNIANSQTTAFKRIDTSFQDLIPNEPLNAQVAGNVIAMSRTTNDVQGDVQSASIGTFMAISGDGYFVVEKPTTIGAGTPQFSGTDLYTRRGDFQTDKSGYLVNGAGYYLSGIPIDPVTGNLSGSEPQVLQFQNGLLPAQSTTEIDYQANLPAMPQTVSSDPSIPGSELLTLSPLATIDGNNQAAFLDETIGGGTVNAYDSLGNPVGVQMRWGKIDSTTVGGTDTWNLFYQVDSSATGTQAAWQNVGTDYVFDATGQLNPPVTSLTLSGVTINGDLLGNIQLVHNNAVTQFADPNGSAQVNLLQQNGYAAGALQSLSVDDKGRVVGTYSNGRTLNLAQVTLAKFSAPNALKRIDGGSFEATDASGLPTYDAPGTIIGSSLEGSNTDIADEFTKLIVTQQAYSANTKVITTSNQMVQDLLNTLR